MPGEVSVKVSVETVVGLRASLKVAVTDTSGSTPVAPSVGEVLVTVGAVVSEESLTVVNLMLVDGWVEPFVWRTLLIQREYFVPLDSGELSVRVQLRELSHLTVAATALLALVQGEFELSRKVVEGVTVAVSTA